MSPDDFTRLRERERRAYADGDVELAKLLDLASRSSTDEEAAYQKGRSDGYGAGMAAGLRIARERQNG